MRRILDEYADTLSPDEEGCVEIDCKAEGYNERFLKKRCSVFKGSCEIEIDGFNFNISEPKETYCWIQIIARNVVLDYGSRNKK